MTTEMRMNVLDKSECDVIVNHISNWLIHKLDSTGQRGFVIGVSGGIDSAVVSSLCALTGEPVICVNMPIYQAQDQVTRADIHIEYLCKCYNNVSEHKIDLTSVYDGMIRILPGVAISDLAKANLRSRIRMATLYSFAGTMGYLVTGTGNKVEDFGVGFFTKYGDGGVDVSPIGDLLKTEVWALGRYMGVDERIITSKPTDGLWEDNRSDEDQLGATYEEIEWALGFCEKLNINTLSEFKEINQFLVLSEEQINIIYIYLTRHEKNSHKMEMPPICHIERPSKSLKNMIG